MFGLSELAFIFSLLYRANYNPWRYGFSLRTIIRLVALCIKMFKIHTIAYIGLWVFLGFVLVGMINFRIYVCSYDWTDELCSGKNISVIVHQFGFTLFLGVGGVAMFGSILASASFARMLHSTSFRLENIAHPAGKFMGARFFERHGQQEQPLAFERLVPIKTAEPWLGILLQLIIEQVIFGIIGSIWYGTVPALVALKHLICNGHRWKYVSSTAGVRQTST
jgi:hypothetical protein